MVNLRIQKRYVCARGWFVLEGKRRGEGGEGQHESSERKGRRGREWDGMRDRAKEIEKRRGRDETR